jgi:thiol-disulfide isomerase/thioredoxin
LFLASYCEPCQEMMESYLRLEKRYRRLNTDFVYVFAHDTKDDAEGYMKEFGLRHGILANFDALKAFHNPKLPTIYVGDRHGWLMTRFEESSAADLAKLDTYLRDLTAF